MITRYTSLEIDIDLSSIISEYDDDDLVMEIEERGYTLLDSTTDDTRRLPNQNLHEELCDRFEISRFSTKAELLKHINSQL